MKKTFYISLFAFVLLLGACGLKPSVRTQPAMPPDERLFAQGEAALIQERYQKALDLFASYLDQYPDRHRAPDALMRMGEIYLLTGKPTEAADSFESLIRTYAQSALVLDARIGILQSRLQKGEKDRLLQESAKLLQKAKTKQQRHRVYMLIGDTHTASEAYRNAVEMYEKSVRYANSKQKLQLGSKIRMAASRLDVSGLLSLLGRLEEKATRGYLLFQLGESYLADNDIRKAISQLSLLVEKFPEHEMAPTAERLLSELEKDTAYQKHTIGCLLPLSGRFEAFGNRALRGIEFALAQFTFENPDLPIAVIIKDTESSPEKALLAVRELAESKAAAIVGPLISAEQAVVAAQNKGIPIIALNQKDGITEIGDYVFRNFITPKMQAEAIISHSVDTLGLKKLAMLYPNEKYGTTFMRLLWDEAIRQNATIVGLEPYDPDLMDFADPIKKLIGLYYDIPEDLQENDHRFIKIDKNLVAFDPVYSETLSAFLKQLQKPEPDDNGPAISFENTVPEDTEDKLEPFVDFEAIIIPDAPRKAGLIIPQLVFFDIENVYLFGTNLWHSDELIDMAKDNAQGAILTEGFFAQSRSEHVAQFSKEFEGIYGEVPAFVEAVAYDSAKILFEIIRKPNIRFRQMLRDEIAKLNNFQGVTGLSSVDATGDIQKKLYLLQVKGDRFVDVSP